MGGAQEPARRGAPVIVSKKVVRRIMREEGLAVIYSKHKRAYSSHKGGVSEHPRDKVNRDFHAAAPDVLRLTDITQFALPPFKCHLSPVIDCFDGKVVAHRMPTSPNAEPANSMLLDAIGTLGEGEHPAGHSNHSCHCRWPGWISSCDEHGVERSMPKKGCSPDNSACEGLCA